MRLGSIVIELKRVSRGKGVVRNGPWRAWVYGLGLSFYVSHFATFDEGA